MKYICTHKCIFADRSIKKGQIVEISDSERKLEPAKSSFRLNEDDTAEKAPPAPKADKDALTDDEMKRRLAEWGVGFPSKITHAELIKLYASQVQSQTAGK